MLNVLSEKQLEALRNIADGVRNPLSTGVKFSATGTWWQLHEPRGEYLLRLNDQETYDLLQRYGYIYVAEGRDCYRSVHLTVKGHMALSTGYITSGEKQRLEAENTKAFNEYFAQEFGGELLPTVSFPPQFQRGTVAYGYDKHGDLQIACFYPFAKNLGIFTSEGWGCVYAKSEEDAFAPGGWLTNMITDQEDFTLWVLNGQVLPQPWGEDSEPNLPNLPTGSNILAGNIYAKNSDFKVAVKKYDGWCTNGCGADISPALTTEFDTTIEAIRRLIYRLSANGLKFVGIRYDEAGKLIVAISGTGANGQEFMGDLNIEHLSDANDLQRNLQEALETLESEYCSGDTLDVIADVVDWKVIFLPLGG